MTARSGTRIIESSHLQLDPEDDAPWEATRPRSLTVEDWERYEGYIAEILGALGMDLDTPGTARTPERFLKALLDSTTGYEGDPKLLTAFPTECQGGLDCRISQIIEGPISFYSLCEHHALPFHPCRVRGAREHHRDLEAHPVGARVRPPVHAAGTHRSTGGRRPRRADATAWRCRAS